MSLSLHAYGPLLAAIMIALAAAALLPAPRVAAPSLTGRAAASAVVVVARVPVLM
ncbi:hypothetical protein [Novosphingobium sp. AP12]|uniref:hypothetical protein n=1 Tax=Novosphingobium sp. AP12 TaxID=1144305 RepID=UPI000272059B|nr:hypothetical protein [Novosphingobium sp. AP12]EJL25933.1 hypothetical protein PMI02_03140 [Novosphingobium sp. AP12]